MMLQQTQASRVLPKYEMFLKTFATIHKLAEASNENVLKIWSGLGYNRRALYLKAAAEKLSQNPDFHPSHLKTLKGIGENTAGAIYVFSTNNPYVFIETNIRRVFIHEFFKNQENVSDKDISRLIEITLDQKNPRNWYYALMDFGAYLGKAEINPNRKSKHYIKQSKFEGSLRQSRGKILKILLHEKNISIHRLEKQINSVHFKKALAQLENEGFLVQTNDKIEIKPNSYLT